MSDAIERKADGGHRFVAGRGKPGWHRLGTVLAGVFDLATGLRIAGLANWNVRKEELYHRGMRVEGQYANVRTVDGVDDVLAIVGEKYTNLQIEDAFAFTESIVNVGGQWDTMGSILGGTQVFGTILLPRDFILDPQGVSDRVELYVGCSTSFDGSMQTTFFVDPTRVVCKNTQTYALASAKASGRIYKVRHTANAEGRLEDARASLRVAHAEMDALELEAQALYQQAVTNREFDAIVQAYAPVPDEVVKDGKVANKAAITRAKNAQELVHNVYKAGTNDGIRGTAWGALQAFVELQDWYRPTRGDNGTTNLLASQLGMGGTNLNKRGFDKDKTKAREIIRDLVGV